MQELLDFVTSLQAAPENPWERVLAYFGQLGFDGVVCGAVKKSSEQIEGMFIEFPRGWSEQYEREKYVQIDPWSSKLITAIKPIVYSFTERDRQFANRSYKVEQMLCDLYENQLRHSIMFPALPAGDHIIGFNLWDAMSDRSFYHQLDQSLEMLSVAGAVAGAYMRDSVLASDSEPLDARWLRNPNISNPLSPREIEVMSWLAAGLRNDVIAFKMGISIATVKFHLLSVRKKLKAETREQALAIAIARKLIDP